MSNRASRLLDEIEKTAADSSASLADGLRKCLLLGGLSASAELRDWASRELNGYDKPADVPEYRRLGAVLKIDGRQGSLCGGGT